MAIARDRALLLKRYPFGESSLVVHLCTRGHGRVHLMAKGAYRPGSRYFAVLDFLDTLEIEWDHHPARDLSILRAGSIAVRRRRISDDTERWFSATGMLELGDLAARPQHPDPELYDLLEGGLDGLDRLTAGSSPAACQGAFELRFLGVLGLSPALETCAACGGPAPAITGSTPRDGDGGDRDDGRAAFSAGAGGRLCRRCAAEARASGRRVGTLPVRTLADASALLSAGADIEPTAIPSARLDRVRDFAGRFLDYHLETRTRAHRAFLSVKNRNAEHGRVEQALRREST